jgi:hypothetical protein
MAGSLDVPKEDAGTLHAMPKRTDEPREASQPVPVAESAEDAALDPVVREAIRRARHGTPTQPEETNPTLRWSVKARQRIQAWLRAGAPSESLAQLLADSPVLLAIRSCFAKSCGCDAFSTTLPGARPPKKPHGMPFERWP